MDCLRKQKSNNMYEHYTKGVTKQFLHAISFVYFTERYLCLLFAMWMLAKKVNSVFLDIKFGKFHYLGFWIGIGFEFYNYKKFKNIEFHIFVNPKTLYASNMFYP